MQTINFDYLNIKANDLILDIGCGEGRHAIGLHVDKKVDVVGLDLSIEDIKTAKNRIKDFSISSDNTSRCLFGLGNIQQLPFKSSSYNSIICSEVLEHVESPQEAMKEMVRVLKPGGVLAISVPRYLPERICWLLSSEYHNVAGGHKRIFNHNQLKRLAETEGVKYHRFHWAHALHSPYWWLKCLFWGREKDHRLVELYHQFLIWDLMKKPLLTRLLEKLLQPLIGKSLVMYFFKT